MTHHHEPVDPDVDLGSADQRVELSAHHATLAAIALGGVIGAAARHGLELAWPTPAGGFPWATFVTNAVGSLLLGALMVVVQETRAAHPLLRPFAGVGVLGGFTTFSTYAVQVRDLLAGADPHPGLALAYLLGSTATALVAVVAGLGLARLAVRSTADEEARS
ncbi:fluoride efflux transporter FluC [Nocardioides kongjuensis]|uniref:Fluoride-specific ion channel FluC n=1 Tax=Nocardioides kongjuensis TaxID=349522 RepID=A0A852R7J0_9ACTN|nr:CrcB protein [Nocardioides kongjuensis]